MCFVGFEMHFMLCVSVADVSETSRWRACWFQRVGNIRDHKSDYIKCEEYSNGLHQIVRQSNLKRISNVWLSGEFVIQSVRGILVKELYNLFWILYIACIVTLGNRYTERNEICEMIRI